MTPRNMAQVASKARDVMRDGGLVVYPTDTIYGLGTDARNRRAVEAVFAAKDRPRSKPLSMAVASLKRIQDFAVVDRDTEKILGAIFPGPFTAILRSSGAIPHLSYRGKIGIRIPDHLLVAKLTTSFPVTCTSANISGTPEPRTPSEVNVKCSLLIDGGPAREKRPSTVIDLSGRRPEVLRQGAGDASFLFQA